MSHLRRDSRNRARIHLRRWEKRFKFAKHRIKTFADIIGEEPDDADAVSLQKRVLMLGKPIAKNVRCRAAPKSRAGTDASGLRGRRRRRLR